MPFKDLGLLNEVLQAIDEKGYSKPLILADSTPVFLRYPLLVKPAMKMDTDWARRELGVNLGVWFRTNLHPSPRHVKGCPNADRAVAECVNLPCLLPDQFVDKGEIVGVPRS